MSSSSDDEEYPGGNDTPKAFYNRLALISHEDPYLDPSFGLALPSKKKAKKQKEAPNGTDADGQKATAAEEAIDTSKLDIKFVDQTWDVKRVSGNNKFFSASKKFQGRLAPSCYIYCALMLTRKGSITGHRKMWSAQTFSTSGLRSLRNLSSSSGDNLGSQVHSWQRHKTQL